MRRHRMTVVVLLVLASIVLASCQTTYQVKLPERLGVPLAVLELELPAGSLQENEDARFEIDFEVDLRGRIQQSSMRASTRPDLNATILEQHRQWIYAVSTRADPCIANAFIGTQTIEINRRDGKLAMELQPAHVNRRIHERAADWIGSTELLKPESIKKLEYTMRALLDAVQGTVGVMFEFGPDGKARNAYSVNAVADRWV